MISCVDPNALKPLLPSHATDIDDFIVDDDGQPITSKRGKKYSGFTDA
jgi:hypothetical protein